jgi:hypothetical protein
MKKSRKRPVPQTVIKSYYSPDKSLADLHTGGKICSKHLRMLEEASAVPRKSMNHENSALNLKINGGAVTLHPTTHWVEREIASIKAGLRSLGEQISAGRMDASRNDSCLSPCKSGDVISAEIPTTPESDQRLIPHLADHPIPVQSMTSLPKTLPRLRLCSCICVFPSDVDSISNNISGIIGSSVNVSAIIEINPNEFLIYFSFYSNICNVSNSTNFHSFLLDPPPYTQFPPPARVEISSPVGIAPLAGPVSNPSNSSSSSSGSTVPRNRIPSLLTDTPMTRGDPPASRTPKSLDRLRNLISSLSPRASTVEEVMTRHRSVSPKPQQSSGVWGRKPAQIPPSRWGRKPANHT